MSPEFGPSPNSGVTLWSGACLSVAAVAVGLMVSLPFLNPIHTYPLPTFYEEVFAFGLGLLAFACVGLGAVRTPIAIPVISMWVAVFAAYLLLQPQWMELAYEETAQSAGLYALWAAAITVVGANLRATLGTEKFARLVAGAMLLSALINAGAGLVQELGLVSALGGAVTGLRGNLVYGNLAQHNLYANHLVIGAACLAYLWASRQISIATLLASSALLAYEIHASGSRASMLMLGGLVLWSLWVWHYQIGKSGGGRFLASLSVIAVTAFALGLLGYPFADSSGGASARLVRLNSETGDLTVRLAIWEVALRTWFSAPILGVGFGGFSWAHFNTLTPWTGAIPMNSEINAHNILAHFLAETGLVGTAILGAGLVLWFLRVLGGKIPLPIAWTVAVVGAELLHSLVEFPLWYAHFLGVTALLAGFADPRQVAVRSALAAKGLATGALLLGGTLLAFTTRSYEQLRFWGVMVPQEMRSVSEVRLAEQKVIAEAERSLLRPYADVGLAFSLKMTREDVKAKLAFNSRVLRFWQVYPLVENQIALLAMAGRDAEALQLMEHLARLMPQFLPNLAEFLRKVPDSELPSDSLVRASVASLIHKR